MGKMTVTCDICERTTKFPAPKSWLNVARNLTICHKCGWPQLGNCLMGVFKFSTQEETAGEMRIPPRSLSHLNTEQIGRNLQSIAKHIVRFAANLPLDLRLQALTDECPWPKLSARVVELFELPNMTYLQYKFGLSLSTISELNNQKAGPTMTRMMRILVNLAEKLNPHQRQNFLQNKKFFLD